MIFDEGPLAKKERVVQRWLHGFFPFFQKSQKSSWIFHRLIKEAWSTGVEQSGVYMWKHEHRTCSDDTTERRNHMGCHQPSYCTNQPFH